ncbi:restriction endonuclease subunit S [Streptomyces rimosus]|uniref:restriction endonuclease subunit S n=1 Tax=Streptomyces rimosus TaxID=1927 RepID=UPI00099DE8D2|nr:restriction endonuclease subunit S [Streptomyces rimosus]
MTLGLGADSGDGQEELPGGGAGELPPGWARATLGELGEWYGGGTPSKKRPEFWTDGTIPWLSPKDMGPDILVATQDLIHKSALDDSPVKLVPGGSVALVVRSGILERKVPVTYVPFEVTLNQDMKAVKPYEGIDDRWLAWAIRAREQYILENCRKRGTTVASLEMPWLMDTEVLVPPLAEQRRIAAEVEQQITHIEAGEEALRVGFRKIDEFRKSIICSAIPDPLPDDWDEVTVGEAGKVDLGRQRHPSWHSGPEMKPYLRVANVFEDHIDTSDVKEMDFSGTEEKYALKDGDVLLNEGQSPHLLGRPAIYRGTPEGAAFQNTLLRFRPNSRITSEWALLVFRRHMHTGRFMKESRITTNIAHLSAARLKTIEFPFPSVDRQELIVKQVRRQLEDADRMDAELRGVTTGSADLRAALLNAAFTGTLVPQDPADEPASNLLDRIRAARATAQKAPRKRKQRSAPPGQEELPQ